MIQQQDLFAAKPDRPFKRALEGSSLAMMRWSGEQIAQVDAAIARCAELLPFFTADAVWEVLWHDDPEFPVTKALTARLLRAQREGLIRSTGQTRHAERGGDHDHGQRLTVWRSLVCEGVDE